MRGGEIGIQGRITAQLEVVGGYTYLDPKAIGLAGAGIEGPIPNTAHHQANLWTNYELSSGFKVGVGVNYISERFAGTDNLLIPGTISVPTVPGYVTWDAMLGYRVNRQLSLQLNAFNLTDKGVPQDGAAALQWLDGRASKAISMRSTWSAAATTWAGGRPRTPRLLPITIAAPPTLGTPGAIQPRPSVSERARSVARSCGCLSLLPRGCRARAPAGDESGGPVLRARLGVRS